MTEYKYKSKLSYDGRQLMLRVPKFISKTLKLEKGEILLWEIKKGLIYLKRNKTQESGK